MIFLTITFSHSLNLVNLNSSLSGMFESFTDDNEGTTGFRSLNIPSGGRVESLGTAFTGLCDDISFFDYNPAASAVLEQSEIAVFHNAWIADSAMETLAATRRHGNLGYGGQIKCFYVPFTEYNLFGDKLTGSYYSETSAIFNMAYNFLSGYTFKGIAVGFNAKAAWRYVPDYTNNQTNEVISGSGLEQSALAILADAGMLMSFNLFKMFQDRRPNFRIGLALNNAGLALTGFGDSIKIDDPVSSRLSAGLSYRPFSKFLISMEIRQPLNLQDLGTTGKFAAASGLELAISDKFSVETGFLIQGGNPRISLGSEFEILKMKMDVCYTFDLTSSSNPVNHISLSAKLKFGDRGRNNLLEKADEKYIDGIRLYAAGEYTEAILKFNEAIKLAKTFPLNIRYEPAIEARNMAITFNRNKKALENIQNISDEEVPAKTQNSN